MKWTTAIGQIETMLAMGESVVISYHRKWMKNDSHIEDVQDILSYEYQGKECKAVQTAFQSVEDGNFIIDEVFTIKQERENVIKKMFDLANFISGDNWKNWTRDRENHLWDMCSDWNREHEDEEIFMCETSDDDDNVNGFMIEDDPFYYPVEN